MPFIETKTNVQISADSEARIRAALGKAIEIIRGKSERWLMLSFLDSVRMSFSGSCEPTAIIEVKIFGKATDDEYSRLTARITEIISEELSIPTGRIYVKYEQTDIWGYAGSNF